MLTLAQHRGNACPATVERQLTQHRNDDADDANAGDDGEGMPQEADALRHHPVRYGSVNDR